MSPTTETEGRLTGCNSTIFHHVPDQLLMKDGQQIPGYLGHCPLLRYDFGKTFGQGTHEAYLARTGQPADQCRSSCLDDPRTLIRSRTALGASGLELDGRPQSLTGLDRQKTVVTKKGHVRRGLPESDGQNKYTENMVPGYTGYIPRHPFQFGSSYKEECDVCLDEHFSNLERQRTLRQDQLLRTSRSAGSLHSISGDPLVRDRLNRVSGSNHPAAALTPRLGVYNPPVLDKDCELPVPGYQGFIPRVRTTDIGLGTRYTEQTKNGLDAFYDKKLQREAKLGFKTPCQDRGTSKCSISIDRNPALENAAKWSSNCRSSEKSLNGALKDPTIGYRERSTVCERASHNPASNGLSHQDNTADTRVRKSVAFVV